MFMPPIERCAATGAWVRLDRSQHECALAHRCERAGRACPLAPFFTVRNEVAGVVKAGPWRPRQRKTGT
jgi:hypothetical protein